MFFIPKSTYNSEIFRHYQSMVLSILQILTQDRRKYPHCGENVGVIKDIEGYSRIWLVEVFSGRGYGLDIPYLCVDG